MADSSSNGPDWQGFIQGLNSGLVSNNPATLAVNTGGNLWNLLKAGAGVAGKESGLLSTDQMPEMTDMSKVPLSSEWLRGKLEDNPNSTSATVGNLAGGLLPTGAAGVSKLIAGATAKNAPAMATGMWFRGKSDNAPRWEFSDQNANLTGPVRPGADTTLGKVLDHPELYDNYPSLKYLRVKSIADKPGSKSDFDAAFGTDPETGQTTLFVDPNLDPAKQRSVILHEVQHAVQHKEGFLNGADFTTSKDKAVEFISKLEELRKTDPNQAAKYAIAMKEEFGIPLSSLTMEKELGDFNKNQLSTQIYYRTPGEIEARAVQARRDFSPVDRKATTPQETMDKDAQPLLWEDVKKRFTDLGLD